MGAARRRVNPPCPVAGNQVGGEQAGPDSGGRSAEDLAIDRVLQLADVVHGDQLRCCLLRRSACITAVT